MNEVRCGDCLWALEDVEEGAVDLIITSPPYAMRRKGTYGGVPEAEYVDWFCERADQFERVLSVFGSFVLNIKEHCVKGERSDYVMRLVLALRARGWRLVDQFIWHKPNPVPGHWPTRLKDGWEHCFHFAVTDQFRFFPDEVRQEAKHDYGGRRRSGRTEKATGSGFGYDYGREQSKLARPSNVITAAVGSGNKDHSAVFPHDLAEFFIGLMTTPGDLVLDPFAGSGTSLEVAKRLGRRYLGVEIDEKHAADARERLARELV